MAVAPTQTVPVSRAIFDRICALLRRLTDDPARDAVAGLEPTGGYYARTVHALPARPAHPRWVRNNAVHDARDAIYGKKTKTDQVDSRLIAQLLTSATPSARSTLSPPAVTRSESTRPCAC